MDAQEIKQLKELQDAYLSVYEAKKVDQDEDFELWVNDLINEGYDLSEYTWDEMYESYLDEGLRSAVKRLLGGGKKEAPKPQSRGDQLRARYNVGPEGSETSAKRKILDRAKGNAKEAQKQVDMGNAPQSYANRATSAVDSYLRAGYSKYGADRPVSGGQGGSGGSGRGSKARRRAEALNKEELEFIVNALVEEGYDLSSYTWDEMYDICLDEAVEQLDEISPEVIARTDLKRRKNLDAAEKKEMGARDAGATGELSRLSANTSDAAAKVSRHRRLSSAHARSRSRINKEEVDIFDAILEHLIAEGYANTNESALVIMANMSEGWRQSIVDSSI
jgi:hypothetical protein